MKTAIKKIIDVSYTTMIVLLITILVGLVLQTWRTLEFLKDCEDRGGNCGSWIGLVYMIFIPAEFYFLVFYFWLKSLKKLKIHGWGSFLQLVIILVLGIIPALVMAYAILTKS